MNDAYRRFVCELHGRQQHHHLVVVLFNVYRGPVPGTPYLRGTHDPDGVPSRAFVHRRLPLLLSHTLPSLAGQSTDNLAVVVLYERTTELGPEWAAVDRYAHDAPIPIERRAIDAIDFTTGYAHAFWDRREAEEEVARRWWRGQPWLLVTYLDGDDLLHTDYCRRVQAAPCPEDTQVVCAPLGYVYDSRGERVAPYSRLGNRQPPFFTLRYRAEQFLTGERWHGGPGRHLHVAEHLRAVSLGERLWAQHVHGANDSTRWSGEDLQGEERVRVLRALGRPPGGVEPAVARTGALTAARAGSPSAGRG